MSHDYTSRCPKEWTPKPHRDNIRRVLSEETLGYALNLLQTYLSSNRLQLYLHLVFPKCIGFYFSPPQSPPTHDTQCFAPNLADVSKSRASPFLDRKLSFVELLVHSPTTEDTIQHRLIIRRSASLVLQSLLMLCKFQQSYAQNKTIVSQSVSVVFTFTIMTLWWILNRTPVIAQSRA